jgi:prolyl-tRNA editing enzyme YbaK/EbsC (Cys-tRNA(Pro) deacylase)
MAIEEIERIKKVFAVLKMHPLYREHAPAITSEEASKNRGDLLKQGIKALLFTNGEGEFVIVNLPADKKVNVKKISEAMGWSRNTVRMATPEEVREKTGCDIGAVPPFGHKTALQLLVDIGVYDNEENAFNIGLRTHSVKVSTKEMKIVFEHEKAREGMYAK